MAALAELQTFLVIATISRFSAEEEVLATLRQRLLCAPKLPSEYGRLGRCWVCRPSAARSLTFLDLLSKMPT
jgi:hypothetical protein